MYLSFGQIDLWITADDLGITAIDFTQKEDTDLALTPLASQHLKLVEEELTAYFNGELQTFTVPIHFTKGTDFQIKVWQSLIEIPYGEIKSYQDIAIMVGSPQAQQAVGQANRHNPIPIIVPCHRVIGKNGKLVGYSGNSEEGLLTKQFLLDLELKNGELF